MTEIFIKTYVCYHPVAKKPMDLGSVSMIKVNAPQITYTKDALIDMFKYILVCGYIQSNLLLQLIATQTRKTRKP